MTTCSYQSTPVFHVFIFRPAARSLSSLFLYDFSSSVRVGTPFSQRLLPNLLTVAQAQEMTSRGTRCHALSPSSKRALRVPALLQMFTARVMRL
jgi:hypothetical protein